MKTKTKVFPVIGAYGLHIMGPNSICGSETRGGVAVATMGPHKEREAGGVMSRETVIELHSLLGEFIESWKKNPTP